MIKSWRTCHHVKRYFCRKYLKIFFQLRVGDKLSNPDGFYVTKFNEGYTTMAGARSEDGKIMLDVCFGKGNLIAVLEDKEDEIIEDVFNVKGFRKYCEENKIEIDEQEDLEEYLKEFELI